MENLTRVSTIWFYLNACFFQCPETQIGNVFKVLNQRRGTVFDQQNEAGTKIFNLKAYLPVMESFGKPGSSVGE